MKFFTKIALSMSVVLWSTAVASAQTTSQFEVPKTPFAWKATIPPMQMGQNGATVYLGSIISGYRAVIENTSITCYIQSVDDHIYARIAPGLANDYSASVTITLDKSSATVQNTVYYFFKALDHTRLYGDTNGYNRAVKLDLVRLNSTQIQGSGCSVTLTGYMALAN